MQLLLLKSPCLFFCRKKGCTNSIYVGISLYIKKKTQLINIKRHNVENKSRVPSRTMYTILHKILDQLGLNVKYLDKELCLFLFVSTQTKGSLCCLIHDGSLKNMAKRVYQYANKGLQHETIKVRLIFQIKPALKGPCVPGRMRRKQLETNLALTLSNLLIVKK